METKPTTEIAKVPIEVNGKGLVLRSLDDLYRWGKFVISSGLAPKWITRPEQAIVATQAGMELGLSPFRSLKAICVVNGNPTVWGDTALGLVKASPVFEWHKEWIDGEGDKRTAWCETKRKGAPESMKTSFTVLDAKRAALWTKKGTWESYPDRMLKYRARGFNLRDNFPDVLCGFHLSEEFDMIPEKDYEPTTPPRAERKPVENTAQAEPVDIRKRIDDLQPSFALAVANHNNTLTDEKITELFLQWVSFNHPGTTAADWKDPARWTEETVTLLESALLGKLPQAIVELIPQQPTAKEQANELFR